MTGEEHDKTQVLLERVKALEERARMLLQLSVLIVSVASAVAALTPLPIVRVLVLTGSGFFTTLSTLQAISYLAEAESVWGRLLRDPGSHKLLLAAFTSLSAMLFILAILALLGLWR